MVFALVVTVVCPGEESGNYANPSDCGSYIICMNVGTRWEQTHQMDCPSGLHYDAGRELCDWPDRANCQLQEVKEKDDQDDANGI